jgi:hypothetical protein
MGTTPLSAARATAPVVMAMLMVPLAAHAPEHSSARSTSYNFTAKLAVFRDDSHSKVTPCLIGTGSCASAYPPPTLCLVSTERCSADFRIEFANAGTH